MSRMLTIEIVSDIVCPWCFIGLRRLDVAIAKVQRDLPDFTCEKRWRPFFLNPDTPPEGEPYLPFLEKKFGGRAPVEALFERVRAAGRPYGIEYAFEKIERRANTLLAHRLIYWAQQRGNAEALVERLFAAQFQRGEAVGDPAMLLQAARTVAIPLPRSSAILLPMKTSKQCVPKSKSFGRWAFRWCRPSSWVADRWSWAPKIRRSWPQRSAR
jgi:predicted DsbA family dithiol-disulfide isomerase